ncbi:hypothetical protein Thena_1823 [Thermodesulfobium narugense DSM 14796]|uniref:DUF4405 domain-containing protein n=1 Tax=Thermodesulfobium narugense DSM 14796 TaxID=747365 RepID=M1E9K3_9BACT|nr:DUF4405 domain-containing protein [Thermodesulfobium narugense]AEE15429.1 hypothetical protein Thena_1823 [Thermodesulfobium narugense DSM 14796]
MCNVCSRRSFIKKLIGSFVAFKLFSISSDSLADSSSEVWGQCPKGLQYDPYPGKCSRYIDTNNDGYCDYSEPPPKSTSNINPSYSPNTDENFKSTQPLFGDDIAEAANRERRRSIIESYNTGTLSILAILFSLVSSFLVQKKIIKKQTLLKICNFVLAISFVISATLGMILSLKYDGLISLLLPSWVLFLHVEFGIVFCVFAILHLVLNWKSMLCLFNLNGKKN